MDNLDPDFGKFLKPAPRQSLKPLGSSNSLSSYDRKGGYYGNQKSPPSVRKTLFESRNKENDESMLCKDFTDREVTGKSPIVVPSTRSKKSETFCEVEEKRVKPRRSMLGLRSKLLPSTYSKDDTTFTLSKPLHSSSPNSESFRQESRPGQGLHKATSSPSLNHPFDNDDHDASSFFTKGISDSSTWSVFKSNKNSGKTTNYLQETPLTRASIGSSRFQNNDSNTVRSSWMENHNSTYSKETDKNGVTADQKMQLEWLSMKFQTDSMLSDSVPNKKYAGNRADNNFEPRKSYRNDKTSSLKNEAEEHLTFGARTRAQAKKEREKFLGGSKRAVNTNEAVSPIPHEKEASEGDNKSPNSIAISDNDSSQDNSMDSYVQNEATIIGTCKKQFKDTGEECLSSLTETVTSKNKDVCSELDSDEYLSTNEDSPNSTLVNKISNLICDLKIEKEELNLKLTAYLEQKNRYETKLDNLMTCLEKMKNNFEGGEKNSKAKTSHSEKATSHSKIQKKEQGFLLPSDSLSKQPLGVSKQFSGLKANFNCLKTPIRSSDKIKQIRKSVCYTPNSLSVLVGDQVKDIFGDM